METENNQSNLYDSESNTQGSLFDQRPTSPAENGEPNNNVNNNGFTRYVVVGYTESGVLDIGVPEGQEVSVADLWAYASVLNVKANNIYTCIYDKQFQPIMASLERIETRLSTVSEDQEAGE